MTKNVFDDAGELKINGAVLIVQPSGAGRLFLKATEHAHVTSA
jgi:hypothetical protein